MKIKHILTALLLPLSFTACQRDDDQPQPAQQPYHLLRKVEYASTGMVANLQYDTDSTLKQVNYNSGSAAGSVFFKYANKQLTESGIDASLYSNNYTYQNGRVTKVLNKWKQGNPPTSYYLEYTYNNDGTVATQKYYHTNEAGTTLKAQSVYQYNSQKLVKQITTTQENGHMIIFKIDAYSDVYSATPLAFINQDLNEFYTLYNYPVLSQMNRLPAKITQYRKPVGGPEAIERIDEQNFQITNQQLVKMFSKISYPANPGTVSLDTVTYTY